MTPNHPLSVAVISCSQSVVPCPFDVVGIFLGGVDVTLFKIYFYHPPQKKYVNRNNLVKNPPMYRHISDMQTFYYMCFRITSLASLMMVQTRRLMR